ncbi:uncharacterized protein LOC142768647 [Rhipicephalus microplus]|uniref:uncharacterized protein LOC142768647 n=1 Tax=Rhipicephalus microplus TaxID=6941 RepID=UPI003F6D381D
MEDQQQGKTESSDLTVPPGKYVFILFGPNCVVMKLELTAKNQATPISERQQTDDTPKFSCMLWVKKDDANARSCCDDYFKEHCNEASQTYVGTGDTCKETNTVS